MGNYFNLFYDLFSENFGDNIFWAFFIVNYVLAAIAYKLGFARDLPLLKSLFVYIMLAIGTFILTIFSILQYPMTETLLIISAVLAVYRFRLHRERKARNE